MKKSIAIMNEKGGVAKTTTAMTFAHLLAKKGFKTLLIDYDGQANSTERFGIDQNTVKYSTFDLLKCVAEMKPLPKIDDFIIRVYDKTKPEDINGTIDSNLDLIPSNASLFYLPNLLMTTFSKEDVTKMLVEYILENRDYDYIVFDTNPQIGDPMLNVMCAVDEIIIPCEMSIDSVEGAERIIPHINLAKRKNQKLKINGILFTLNDNTNASKGMEFECKERIKDTYIYNTKIPRSTKVKEAKSFDMTIDIYDPKSPAGISYNSFVDEFLQNEQKV